MRMGGTILILASVLGAVLLGLLSSDASLLPALLFWVAIGQGLIALHAAAELSNAHWIRPAKETILRIHPLLLIFPILFLVFARNYSIYPWSDHPTGWLNPWLFMVRNTVMLLVTWLIAALYARSSQRGNPGAKSLAVLYLLAYVVNQSLIAFDWVMPLEYPWVSTLFGGYFFIEALYAGIAVTAIMSVNLESRPHLPKGMLSDAATLMFGFSLLWAGQMFAQYLVIWYGNLPHEVSFLAKRVVASPFRELSIAVLLAMFVLPFMILLSRKSKTTPMIVIPLAILILLGIYAERMLFILPVAPLNPAFVILTTVLVGVPLVAMLVAGVRRAR